MLLDEHCQETLGCYEVKLITIDQLYSFTFLQLIELSNWCSLQDMKKR